MRQRRFVHMGEPHLAGLQTVVHGRGLDGDVADLVRHRRRGRPTPACARYRRPVRPPPRRARAARARPVDASCSWPAPPSPSSVSRWPPARPRWAVPRPTSRRLWQEPGRVGHELELPMRPGVAGHGREGGRARDLPRRGDLRTRADGGRAARRRARVRRAAASATSWPGTSCGGGSGSTSPTGTARRRRARRTDTLRTLRLSMFHVLQSVSPHDRRPRRGHPRPRSARRGLPRARLLGRAVRVPGAHPAAAQPGPGAAALPRAAAGRRPPRGPGGRTSRGDVPVAVRQRRPGGEPAGAPQPAVGALAPRHQPPAAPRRSRRRLQHLAVLPGHRRPGVPRRPRRRDAAGDRAVLRRPRRPTTRPATGTGSAA